MKISLLMAVLLFLSVKLQAQNFLYIGDDSYPAKNILYFSCKTCGWNSYQEKLQEKDLRKYNTLEFQIGGNDTHSFVRISVSPRVQGNMGLLQDKISIFFNNGQRVVLSKPIYREKIDDMQELFFELSTEQTSSIQNNTITKIQYSIKVPAYNNDIVLADAILLGN